MRSHSGVPSTFPIPTAWNVSIIMVQWLAFFACCWWAARIETWTQTLGLALVFGILGNSIYSVLHEAEHGILLPNRRLNDLAGVMMALLFPAPFHLLRQGHLGHHLRNRSDDEAFDLVIEGEHPVWKRIQFYGIITGFYWLAVVLGNFVALFAPTLLRSQSLRFDKATAALLDSLNPRYLRLIRIEACAALAFHTSVVWAFGIAPATYFCVYFGFGWMWSAMQYVHHFGTERHVVRGTRNLWVWRPLDAVWLHHNLHLNHHAHPTVPWIHLPKLSEGAETTRGFLPWYYLRMWRGPQPTAEHVENRYAGRIID